MKKAIVVVLILSIAAMSLLVLAGCIEQEDVDALKAEIEALKEQVSDLKGDGAESNVAELEAEIETLKSTIASLQSKDNALQTEINNLRTRVQKLETSVKLIDKLDDRITDLENKGGETLQFNELKAQVEMLQEDLLTNSSDDEGVKAQVSQMQLQLDAINAAMGDNDNFAEVLTSIQNDITALYGEVDRVLPFENGKEYEVKLNGVVYYTVSILIEYHNGKVQSEQDIIVCNRTGKHWCGSVLVKNRSYQSIHRYAFENMMYFISDGEYAIKPTFFGKEGTVAPIVTEIANGEAVRWYFDVCPGDFKTIDEVLDVRLGVMDREELPLLYLEDAWDGVQEPIIGEGAV